MSSEQDHRLTCPHCGHVHSKAVENCTACGAQMDAPPEEAWSARRDSLKMRWVAAVLAFWVSAAVLVIVFFVDGRLSLVLISICLGLLLVGVSLKTRYQLHLRKGPGGS